MHAGSVGCKRGTLLTRPGNLCGSASLQSVKTGKEDAMSNLNYRSSRPNAWLQPRPHRDPSQRFMTHGPILPMEQPGFWQRLLSRR